MTELERKHLVETDRHIAECKVHIAKQCELIDGRLRDGALLALAQSNL